MTHAHEAQARSLQDAQLLIHQLQKEREAHTVAITALSSDKTGLADRLADRGAEVERLTEQLGVNPT